MADITEGKLITESSLIPFIRRQDVMFDADNLRPQKIARLFFDDIVMNGFAQKGNEIILNSKKVLSVTPNSGAGADIHVSDIVYQGSSNITPSFLARVDAYNSTTTTLRIRSMSGNFDDSANVFVENVITGTTTTTANISKVVNQNTSDTFSQSEGVYCANSNVFMKVIGSSGENVLYVDENFINCTIDAYANVGSLVGMTNDYKVGDLVFQTPAGSTNLSKASFVGRVEYYNPAAGANTIAITALTGKLNTDSTGANASSKLWNSSNTVSKPLTLKTFKTYDMSNGHVIISTSNTSRRVTIVSHVHHSSVIANTSANTAEGGGQFVYLNSAADASRAVGNLIYLTAGTGMGVFRRVLGTGPNNSIELTAALDQDPTPNTKYSIGNHIVDNNGTLAGIINIPEESNFKFRTGDRIFTITDVDAINDSDYTMKASAKFTAGGLATVAQNINLQFPTTPIELPLPETPPGNAVMPADPVSAVASPQTTNQPVTINAPATSGTGVINGGVNPVTRRSLFLVPSFPIGDPIAQTFFTPKPQSNKVSYGVFVSSVDLFFGAKPSLSRASLQLPVTVKIASVSNGFPTKRYIAQRTVKCKDVNVSTSPSTDNPDTITKFTFSDPVYLEPNKEYALVVVSESPEYEVYVAELGGNVLGADPPRRISEQPYAGSFFRSQNATTWTPYQNEDLMFVINKAVFSGTGQALFTLKETPTANQDVDRLLLNTKKLTFPVGQVDFKVKGLYKSNTAYDTYNYIVPQQQFKYGDLLDNSNKTTAANSLNTRKVLVGNANSIIVQADFVSSDTDISPIFNMESLSVIAGGHNINDAGISNSIISIVNRGAGYNATVTSGNSVFGSSNNTLNNAAQLFRQNELDNDWNIGFYNLVVTAPYGSGADGFAVANTNGANTVDYIVINSVGSGYIETPAITVANGNAATNVTCVLSAQGETSKRGGNIFSKYLTRQITLEDGFESGDLRVYMDVVRPNGTDIQCYYKVLGSEDNDRFSDKSWVRMFKAVDKTSKNQTSLVELTFRPDLLENKLKYVEAGQEYPIGGKFKHFAIKVALTSTDAAVVPVVTNLRIIATPEG